MRDSKFNNYESELITLRFAYDEDFNWVEELYSSLERVKKGKVILVSMSVEPTHEHFYTRPDVIRNALTYPSENASYIDIFGNYEGNTFDLDSRARFKKAFIRKVLSSVDLIIPDLRFNYDEWEVWFHERLSS